MSRFPQPIGGSGAAMPTTPGNDPIDSLSQPRAAAAPRSSGPHRTPRSSPSPSPYGRGGETPRASRMSSASDAALRQGRSRSSPPRSTPGSHRGASPISLGGGPDDDDMGDDDPPLVGSSQFDRDLTYNANWLRLLDPTGVATFDDFDKEAIARGLTVEYDDETLATLSNGLVTILVTSYKTGSYLLYFISRSI